MCNCWHPVPEQRPSTNDLKQRLMRISDTLRRAQLEAADGNDAMSLPPFFSTPQVRSACGLTYAQHLLCRLFPHAQLLLVAAALTAKSARSCYLFVTACLFVFECGRGGEATV
jgi:hypothetical protein